MGVAIVPESTAYLTPCRLYTSRCVKETGTGAIMAVPAGDQRDYDYATEFELPIVDVIAPVGVSDLSLIHI